MPFFALACFLFWAYAGTSALGHTLGVCGLLGIAFLGIAAVRVYRNPSGDFFAAHVLFLGLYFCTFFSCLWIMFEFPHSEVLVENGSEHVLEVKRSGENWVQLQRGERIETLLRRGDYEMVTINSANGKELDRRRVRVDGAPKVYCLNLLGANTYRRETTVKHSDPVMDVMEIVRGPRVELIKEIWFESSGKIIPPKK
jgi:hypothetical protein